MTPGGPWFPDGSIRNRVAAGCFIAAMLVCALGLVAWMLSRPLPGSRFADFAPLWPPTLIANLMLAAALWCGSARECPPWRRRIASAVVMAATGLALVLLVFVAATGTGASPVSCLLILTLGLTALILDRRDGATAAALIAAMTISFAILLLAGHILTIRVAGFAVQPWHIPILTNLAELLIGVGLLLAATQRLLAAARDRSDDPWPVPLRIVPALMVAPALVLAVELLVLRVRPFPATTEIAGMLANTLIVGSLLLWAMARLARQRARLNRAQSARAASDERLVLAAQAHRIGIFEWDLTSDTLSWHADTDALLDLPPGTLTTADQWRAAVLPEDHDLLRKKIEAAGWAKAEQISFVYRIRLPDGKLRAIEGSARCMYDEAGELVRTVGINIDVTERVEQTAKLAAREAQMRSILETVPSAMVVIDTRGRIQSFSPAAERLFGHQANDVIGSNVSLLMNEEFGLRHDAFLSRYLKTGERHIIGRPRILTARHRDGSEFPIELHVGEAVHENSRVFTGFITDLSDRLKREEQLQQLGNELAQIGRINAMGELAAALAHEINQPLAAIANHVATMEMILDDALVAAPLRARLAAQLRSSREQALRAGEIIRRLRDFVARREVDLRVEPVEAAIQEASALVLVGTQRLEVSLHYDLAPDASFMFADKIQIQQVLVNLMRNALEAVCANAADQRSITVATRKLDGDRIEFSVSDNGPGLSGPMLEQLYLPFTSTKGEGNMGIGLLICRRIVEAHGGAMSAHNNEQGGATFRFTVPGIERRLGEE